MVEDKANVLSALSALDLTLYEAEAYLSLVAEGPARASEVGQRTEIPYSKTYEVLSRLQTKGLVHIQQGRPRIFKAVQPELGVERLERLRTTSLQEELDDKKRALDNNYRHEMRNVGQSKKQALEMLQVLSREGSRVEVSDDVVWTLHGRDSISLHVAELLSCATRKVLMALPDDDFAPYIDKLRTLVARRGEAGSEGIDIEVIANRDARAASLLGPSVAVYRSPEAPPLGCGMVVVDGARALFIQGGYETAFMTTSKSLAAVLVRFFMHERDESVRVPVATA